MTESDHDRIAQWADFVHTRRGRVAHVRPHLSPRAVLCGRLPMLFDNEWYGTGSQDEIERARRLRLCSQCKLLSAGRTR